MKWSATVKFWDSFWRPIINCILSGRLVNDVYPHKIWDFVLDPWRCIDSEMFWSPNLVLLSLHNRQQRRARVADKNDDSLSNFWVRPLCWQLGMKGPVGLLLPPPMHLGQQQQGQEWYWWVLVLVDQWKERTAMTNLESFVGCPCQGFHEMEESTILSAAPNPTLVVLQ